MKTKLRRITAGIALAAAVLAGTLAATNTTALSDTAWGAPAAADDTAWGAPPANGSDEPVTPPQDTAWG